MKIPIVIIKLLFFGALFIVSNHELYLSDNSDREVFFDLYYSWLNGLIYQSAEITSYVVKFEWLPLTDEEYRQVTGR